MKIFGTDELKGRTSKPLKRFRGKFAWQKSIDDVKNDEESLRQAQKHADRDQIWNSVGIQKA